MSERFDVAVIGAGSGGLVAAVAAASFGQKVVLFEQSRMGGECLNTGCVPSKALLAAANAVHAAKAAARLGVIAGPCVDMAAVRAHVRKAIAGIAPHDSMERMQGLGITVVRAEARFQDAATLVADDRSYTARRIIVATGSRPAVPDIPGLAETPFLTNESLFDLDGLPCHLIVIGGGAIGVEMAQAHRRLGADVTILEAANLLNREDPELAACVTEQLVADGIRISTNCRIGQVAHDGTGFTVRLADGGIVTGSHLLIATGRRASIVNLDLAAGGIAATDEGITVDRHMRTSNRRVYAVGDCTGGPQFTHAAAHQAGIAIRHALFRLPVDVRNTIIPRVTYCQPELAQAGMTEAEARAAHGGPVTVLRQPFTANDRARTEADDAGLIKIVAGKRGRILGVGIAGAQAGELIQPWLLAMNRRLPLRAMVETVLPYPTRGELGRAATLGYFSAVAANSWVRRAIRMLGIFG